VSLRGLGHLSARRFEEEPLLAGTRVPDGRVRPPSIDKKRECSCGAVLSRYNLGKECGACIVAKRDAPEIVPTGRLSYLVRIHLTTHRRLFDYHGYYEARGYTRMEVSRALDSARRWYGARGKEVVNRRGVGSRLRDVA